MKLSQVTAFLFGERLFKTKEEAVEEMRRDVLSKYLYKRDTYSYSCCNTYSDIERRFIEFYEQIMLELKEVDEKAKALDVLAA